MASKRLSRLQRRILAWLWADEQGVSPSQLVQEFLWKALSDYQSSMP
jgi:hypothetical protein